MDKVKALAKELGLLETFVIPEVDSGNSEAKINPKQQFDYAIVIDFEATCWAEKIRYQYPEIIEFPAVLLNISNGKIEDEFHYYVMPIENPKLSEFCTNLTGITQDQVDNAIPLQTCLVLFSNWIEGLVEKFSLSFHESRPGCKTCSFITWSDWDLGVCLSGETQRKRIKKPDILSKWIDIRAIYKKFYNRQTKGLKGTMAELGIPFQGREHSGIVDARNTATLVVRMLQDGCKLQITTR